MPCPGSSASDDLPSPQATAAEARKARPRPARALAPAEREQVLEELRLERFVDRSPAQVWATLLDEGRYLASERTMYRLLAEHGEVRERRRGVEEASFAINPAFWRALEVAERSA